MYFRIFLLFCSLLGVTRALTLKESDAAVWASSKYENDASVRLFKATFSKANILDLKDRLSDTFREFTPPLIGSNFEYGFNTDVLPLWRDHWLNKYDFKARLKYINMYPQFKTNIQGVDIHFVRSTPKFKSREGHSNCTVLPLLILHGFPSCIVEFYKTIPYLTKCVNGIAFDVIVANMPGHGYSDPPTKTGFGTFEAATVMKNLMARLGFNQFYLSSGDITQVGSMMATLYPEKVLGFHTNHGVCYSPLCLALWGGGTFFPSLLAGPTYRDKMFPLWERFTDLVTEIGFLHIMTTSPDAIGVAMGESPVGMMAFLLTISGWLANHDSVHQPDGGLEKVFNRDEIFDFINIYWFSNCLTSTGRLFAETFNNATMFEGSYSNKTSVPTYIVTANSSAVTQAPAQFALKYENLLKTVYLQEYGYFLAYEAPEYYANSIRNAVTLAQAWYMSNKPRGDSRCEL